MDQRRRLGRARRGVDDAADAVLPGGFHFVDEHVDVAAGSQVLVNQCGARARLPGLARQQQAWWEMPVTFFDVERPRVWVFWRRVLHTAHHRTQLTVYLRLLDRPVPPIYGPTADHTWSGADPTTTVEAARR